MNQLQIHRVKSVTSCTDHFGKSDDCREFWILNITSLDNKGRKTKVQFYSEMPLIIEQA